MEIILNKCYGGFGFSQQFLDKYPQYSHYWECSRTDPDLINAVRDFGLKEASGGFARLYIEQIPSNCTDWEMEEYDGIESLIFVVDGKIFHR